MCGGGPDYFLLPILAFDTIIGTKNFLKWTRKRGLQSFKAMGLMSSVLCAGGGLLYAGWDSLPEEVREIFVLVLLSVLLAYPIIDFLSLKREKGIWLRMLWRAPIVLCSVFGCLSIIPSIVRDLLR